MSTVPLTGELREVYSSGFARIRRDFAADGDGRAALRKRAELVDQIVLALWEKILLPHQASANLSLVALGGYGRRALFPFSDVDLLFLHSDSDVEEELKNSIRSFSQELWDLGLKLSPASRSLAECDRFDANNVEFSISLLDARFLAGDCGLYNRLRERAIPAMVMRESQQMVQRLVDLTCSRHAKYGNTLFHLEPNIKDAPGSLRDYNCSLWLALISAINNQHAWPDQPILLPSSMRRQAAAAFEFLTAVRCFLHFRHGRDDNVLGWAAQDEAAAQNIGWPHAQAESHPSLTAADWMRSYFSHARTVHRICTQLVDEVPAAWSSLYRQFQTWHSRISSPEFSVVHGLVYLQQPASVQDPDVLLRLFHFVAHHGVKLSTTTEQRIEQVLPFVAATPPHGAELWIYLQEILQQPHAGDALRVMHALRFLTLVLPELKVID